MWGLQRQGKLTSAVWYDLTSGDGIGGDEEGSWQSTCSPGLLISHAVVAPVPVSIHLYEIAANNYDRLVENLNLQLSRAGQTSWRAEVEKWVFPGRHGNRVEVAAHLGSGSEADVAYIQERNTTAVIALNDPNAITQWAMRDTFSAEVRARTWMFRSLSTLGCNPDGLKRLKPEERAGWFDLIRSTAISLTDWRDLLLCAIERDAAQWAYLIETPKKWRSQTERDADMAFQKVGRTLNMAWYRENPADFREITEQLFYTKKERGA